MVNRGLSPRDIAQSTAVSPTCFRTHHITSWQLIDASLTWKDVEWLR